jgi:5-methyltetrahydropteroyltriglutamate--homocysteine methyltransferase
MAKECERPVGWLLAWDMRVRSAFEAAWRTAMAQTNPPYRAEHVGSLPRPEHLMAAREQYSAGKLSKADLTQIEDECIRDAVAMQERVGIGAITDGEYRKRGWREFLYDKCDGFGPETVERAFPIRLYDGTTAPPIREPKVTARLKKREPLSADDFSALKTMTRGPIKANLPTPSVTHFFTGDAVLDRAAYGNRGELMDDLARIMREEIADLAARGCTYLQMDEVPLAVICDPKNMEVVRGRGDDPDELIDLYIDAINHSIIDRPADMTVCVHLCRGNYAQGMADGGYEPIAERMFDRLDVDGYFLEYDTPRAGDFSPLRHLPKPKKAVLGLVSTKVPELETVDALKRRIDDATKFIDIERLCLSPQCGFASVPARAGRGFPMDLTERKLARVVETAEQVWN